MSAKEMAILAEGVYEEVKKDMQENGIKLGNAERLFHVVFLRGYHACYQHILEMITGQLSIEDLTRKQT